MSKEIYLSYNHCLHSAKTIKTEKKKDKKERDKERNKKEKSCCRLKFCNNMIFAFIVLLSLFLKRLQH